MTKTVGQLRYETDVAQRPTYHDGTARKSWEQLGEVEQWSWERDNQPCFERPTSTCIEHAYGTTMRLSFQINVF